MSNFLSTVLNNYMITGPRYNVENSQRADNRRASIDVRDGTAYMRYLWPPSSFSPQGGAATGYNLTADHQNWELESSRIPTGVHVRKQICGVTRNTDNTVNAGVTLQLFNTATGILVDTQVSDAGGNFMLTDPNAVACFIVAYETGSPDVSGTTLNTLTGV